jgi:hypothetical protein
VRPFLTWALCYKLSIVPWYLQEVLMRKSLSHRITQSTLFHPPQKSPVWQGLPREIRLKVVGLLARLLREHSGRLHASGTRKEAGDE